MYKVAKRYGHELGLSAAFRQWRATSHCRFVHGYALSFEFVFESASLDERNWVIDFGSLKPLKNWLTNTFDHRLLVARDDPDLSVFEALQKRQLLQLIVLPNVGCEAFACEAFLEACRVVDKYNLLHATSVRVRSVQVWEHGANSAIYEVNA